MIYYKTKAEIELARESALLVSRTLAETARLLKPGVTTLSLDKFIGSFIRDHGGVPSFLNYHGFPFNSCMDGPFTVTKWWAAGWFQKSSTSSSFLSTRKCVS